MTPRTLTGPDRALLSRLLSSRSVASDASQSLADLVVGLSHAVVVRSAVVPASVVTLDSVVRVRMLGSEAERVLTLISGRAEPGQVSVLSPIGAALLGRRAGDVVECDVPAGRARFRIEAVVYQPEAAGAGAGIAEA